MEHGIPLRHGLHQGAQLVRLFLGKIILQEVCPAYHHIFHAGHFAGLDVGGVNLLQQIHIHLHIGIHLGGIFLDQLGKGLGIQQLKHGTVAVSHLHHIEGNGGGDAQHEGLSCQLPLTLNVRQAVRIVIHLNDGVPIQPVHLAVSSLTDDLAALHAQMAIGLLHGQHFRKACHVQNFINLGANIDQAELGLHLAQVKDHPQTCAGDVGQLLQIQRQGIVRMLGAALRNFLLDCRSIGGVNTAFQCNGQVPVFTACFQHTRSSSLRCTAQVCLGQIRLVIFSTFCTPQRS